MSVNKVILVGRLGQNPEVRYTPSGAAVANFSVATNENWVDKASGQKQEKTEWHKVVVWGKTAENCNQYLSKGRQVYIEGRLQTRQWQDKDGQTKYTTEVQAQTVQFLGGNAPGERPAGAGREGSASFGQEPMHAGPMGGGTPQDFASLGGSQSSAGPSFTEDDIPF